MDATTRARIQSEIEQKPVVLFMKGTRQSPQCGFSATVIGILDGLIDDYHTVNVLADSNIREGVKEFSDWPTIPQLYIKGEFVGGCDIVKDLARSGQLEAMLGVEAKPVVVPNVTVTAAAAGAFADALQGSDEFVRLEIDAGYNHSLSIGGRSARDVEVRSGGLVLLLDPGSAGRAEGVTIDFVDSSDGPAFKINNPNEPAKVRQISVSRLKEVLASGPIELFDVRTPSERETVKLSAAKLLDRAAQDHIMQLPKTTPLYFHCHHGGRSQQAAQFFVSQGFKEVYNVEGGIDAWARDIDPTLPRYS
jgi:monothiol glutaredoxin